MPKILTSLLVAAALLTLPASAQVSRLMPGRPAGVRPAQDMRTTELYLFGVAALAAVGVGLLAFHSKSTATAATSTSP
jgi:hypothetical protein